MPEENIKAKLEKTVKNCDRIRRFLVMYEEYNNNADLDDIRDACDAIEAAMDAHVPNEFL